jgi:predicted O-methyltransferase YrrM
VTREALAAKLRRVDGFLSEDEGWALYQAARRCAQAAANPRIVEIGSYKGRSTIVLASALAEQGRGSVVAIDPHKPTGKESYAKEHGERDTYAEFLENLAKAAVEPYVVSVRKIAAQARAEYDMQPIDLLFIDGSHDYDDVVADIELWAPLLADRAIVAFNDPYAPGVNRALRERMAGLPFASLRHVNNTLFALARRDRPTSRAGKAELAFYLFVERRRFKPLKLALKGLLETLGVVYVRPSAVRSSNWRLFP